MSDLTEWDRELADVAKELEAIGAAHGRRRLTGRKALVARKVSIIQHQMVLERNLGRLKNLIERDVPRLPFEKEALHRARLYRDRCAAYLEQYAAFVARDLWLKLIKTRLLGDGGTSSAQVDADDLVELAIRQASLAKTESYLAESLVKLRRHRRDLCARYESLGIAAANLVASKTLRGRLGVTPDEAFASPSVKALGTYVKTATASVRSPAANASLRQAEVRLGERTDSALQACRSLIIARIKDPAARPSGRSIDRLQATMRQLEDLEGETRLAYEQILGAGQVEAQPKLAHKPRKRAKRPPFIG